MAELGVYRGSFAEVILRDCKNVDKYLMIDPWRNLSDWNKPANQASLTFETYYNETIERTGFAKNKRDILRGKTTEIINKIENESLGFVYTDGDHTLKGISIDLINIWSKVSSNGFIAGDDFHPSIWQHNMQYEPTMVFPFAVYFSEAVDCKIYALPYNQFIIPKESKGFKFIDLTGGNYQNTQLHDQMLYGETGTNAIKTHLINKFPTLYNI